jgi:nucleotide-binding universal stress UspA family protein
MYDSALHAPIVVGVDGSEVSLDAVEWAAAEAVERHRRLRVVHAFIWPLLRVQVGPSRYGPPDAGLQAQAQRILDEALLRARQSALGIDVAGAMPVGVPVPVLLSEIEQAPLVVPGSRGLGGFSGLLLRSTGVQVAAHASCRYRRAPISAASPNSLTADQVVVGWTARRSPLRRLSSGSRRRSGWVSAWWPCTWPHPTSPVGATLTYSPRNTR